MKKKSKRFKTLFEQKEKNKVENLDNKIDLIKKCQQQNLLIQLICLLK